jgi:hypothetical protein
VNSESVNAILEFVCESSIDHAMAFDPALPLERPCHDIESEMRFPAGAVACMAFMQMRFVLDMQAFRCESRDELGRNDVLHSHDRFLPVGKLSPQIVKVNNRNGRFCGLSSLEAAIDVTA